MPPLLSGLIAAPFTPMHADASLNLGAIESYAARLSRQGVSGAFICGTTGESLSLTIEERMAVAQRWGDAAPQALQRIVHVGDPCQANAIALARHAEKTGAYGIAAMPPCFLKPATLSDLIDWLIPIAAAAPETPFFYYHIPSMTHVAFPMPALLEQAQTRIPTLRGLKFTHYDLMEYQACLGVNPDRLDIAFGRDETLLAALAMGATSAVGSTYNYAAPLYWRMIKAFREHDHSAAQSYSAKVVRSVEILVKYGGLRAGKAIMALLDVPMGPPRLPLRALSPAEVLALQADLEAMDFFTLVA